MVAYAGIEKYNYFTNINDELKNFIEETKDIFKSNELQLRKQLSVEIFRFLTLLIQNNDKENDLYVQNIFKPITDFITAHYADPITNERLSKLTGYSPNYQAKLFKDYYGMTPLDYLNNFRIRKAKSLLLFNKEYQVQTIAFQVGFTDVSRFIKLFKYETGFTPLQYRKNQIAMYLD